LPRRPTLLLAKRKQLKTNFSSGNIVFANKAFHRSPDLMLSPFRRRQFTGSRSPVAMLIAAACGAVLFTLIAGALVYNTTEKLIAANQWVEHTEEVLSSLQRASLLTERVEYRARLYLLTGDEEQLNRAQTAVVLLNTTASHLRILVADNRTQDANVENLSACAATLKKIFNDYQPHSRPPEMAIQQCQQTIGFMTDEEQMLLNQRNQGSQRSSFASILTEIAFVALSLVTLLVLFGFLMRDAIQRQRSNKQTEVTNERLAQNIQALQDRAHESSLLTAARDEIQLAVDLKQVYQVSATALSRLLPGAAGCLCMINNSRQVVEVVGSWGDVAVEDFSPPEACCGLRSGQARWRLPGLSEIDCTHFIESAPACYLCQPIAAHGDTLGILFVQCENDAVIRSVQHRADGVTQLVQIIGMAVATLNLQNKLENQSIRDPLTGLFNRHFMQMSMERELARAMRRKQTLAVLMIDVDHFKRFNDAYGHLAGDAALQAIADIFKTGVRAEDIACRYGGEEFTLILPDTTADGAYARAESLRTAVEKLTVPFDSQTYSDFTISIGMAFFPTDGEACDLLLRHADLALYRSKRLGRNQISLYETTFAEQ
jgi:diguanylate cyclase (GGDEF)-like protein